MKITINDIKKFVNDFYSIDLNAKDRNDSVCNARGLYYYMCYKYSTEIISTKKLSNSVGRKQNGTVLIYLENIGVCNVYNKDLYYRLQILEKHFLEKFDVHKIDYDFELQSRDLLLLKQLHRKAVERNRIYYNKNNSLKNEIKSLKMKLNESHKSTSTSPVLLNKVG